MTSVYFADLRHNHQGVLSVDVMPLGIGFMKAVMDRDCPEVRSRLFAYPERLWSAIQEKPPDVLMLSNYCWNEAIALHMARLMKSVRPESLVVMGGPNLYLEEQRRVDFFRHHEELDVYILGEGDFLATEVVQQFLDAGSNLERFRGREIPSSMVRTPDGSVVLTPTWDRHRALGEIPSPWTTGVMDDFFDGRLMPMVETNRGCPFGCTFCAQGTRWYTKVNYFSVDRTRDDLEYIGRRIADVSPTMRNLCIADPNYGMYEQDVEISGYLSTTQSKYGWPKFIAASTGKNRPDRIMKSLDQINNALTFRQALQSTNPETLAEIKRANVKQSTYREVMAEVQGRGMRSISDLILGLPAETLESHVDSIHQLVDSGTAEMFNFQLMLLKGTELETEDSRTKYAFETRYRLIPRGFSLLGGQKVFETEEIVVSTSTLPFDGYVTARQYAFVFSVFWNNSWFEPPVRLAERHGVKRSEVLDAMLATVDRDQGPAGRIMKDFVSETVGELFPSREACVEYYSRDVNFERLELGDIGDNLLYKYRALASFFVWPEVCAVAFSAIRGLLRCRGVGMDDEFWENLRLYVELAHAHGETESEILGTRRAGFTYDIAAWIDNGRCEDPAPFRLANAQTFEFGLPDPFADEVRAALNVWGTDLKSLTRGVTRIRSLAQVRECRRVDA
ncbi:MAG: radical SAM protein [Candidatus Latescibacterota bacterium]|nr:radical SAM protein [Candidatus Latescibacterota bacterium]